MQDYKQQFISLILEQRVLQFGRFELKSGRISPYFFNLGLINSGKALNQLAQCYAQAIAHSGIDYDILFGPAYKGIPIVCSTALMLSQLYHTDVSFSFNRKEAKQHGEGGNIIGASLQGRVLLLDDVITAGTAIQQAATLIQTHGAHLSGVIIALDRQEAGYHGRSATAEVAAAYQIPVHSIVNLNDIVTYLEHHSLAQEFLPAIYEYRKKYGIND